MNAVEKENTIRLVRQIVDERPTAVSPEGLAGTERMIEALPDYIPAPNSVDINVGRGMNLSWDLSGDVECRLSVDSQGEVHGDLAQKPSHATSRSGFTLAQFVCAKGVADFPSDFMSGFRKVVRNDNAAECQQPPSRDVGSVWGR